jgi:hypothetical protein
VLTTNTPLRDGTGPQERSAPTASTSARTRAHRTNGQVPFQLNPMAPGMREPLLVSASLGRRGIPFDCFP